MRCILFIFCLVFLGSCSDSVKTLSYEGCRVDYVEYAKGKHDLTGNPGHSISNEWVLEAARRKLAICLCESYLHNPSEKVKIKIFELYNTKETYFQSLRDSSITIDSIVKSRLEVFDPTILVD